MVSPIIPFSPMPGGALTANKEIAGSQIGKIQILDNRAFVAVNRSIANTALKKLTHGKLKGRSVKARCIRG